ncbi:hypothetical protein IKO70_03855 [bacterium]|jgi:hypothetical protein|nr:hypothetical protein [bacterium]
MSFSKIFLLFVSLLLASALYADIKDDAQAKASKIADVEAELNKANADASAAKDQKWKSCVSGHLGSVKNLVSSASGVVSKIVALVAAGKLAEAQGQLVILNGMAESAEKSLAAAQSCERSNQTQTKTEQQTVARVTVSSALNLSMGNDMPTEINRGSMEGSDSADAAGIDASGVIQTANDASAANEITATATETPEDASQVEQVPDQEDQSPTM